MAKSLTTSTILIVDSDVLTTKILGEFLLPDYEVVTSRTAQAAVNAMDQFKIDCVVCEFALRPNNGMELLHEIRSYPEWLHIPLLLIVPWDLAQVGNEQWQRYNVQATIYKTDMNLKDFKAEIDRLTGFGGRLDQGVL